MASAFVWPSDDGWPYPDPPPGTHDPDVEIDEDLVALRASRLLAGLEPLERTVLAAHFGLDGTPARSLRELHADLGLPKAELRAALGSGLAKLRTQFR